MLLKPHELAFISGFHQLVNDGGSGGEADCHPFLTSGQAEAEARANPNPGGETSPTTSTTVPPSTLVEPPDDGGDAGESGDDVPVGPTTTTTTTLPPAIPADGSPVQTVASADGDDDAPADEAEADLPEVAKEFGLLEGAGRGRLPKVAFVQDNPALTTLQIGDLVQTAGIDTSLAPAGIPVGRVINRADRPGVAGQLIKVQLPAAPDQLVFVPVAPFHPPPQLVC